ncbi:MAG: hypothetical protein RIE53_06410 [Rhodothermales bacterium]
MKDELTRAIETLVPYRWLFIGLAIVAAAVGGWFQWVLYRDYSIQPHWWMELGSHGMLLVSLFVCGLGYWLGRKRQNPDDKK